MDPSVFYSGLKEILKDIDLRIKPGEKVCLVGKSGSGMSVFLLSIMGEAILTKGNMKLNGKLSYVSMESEVFLKGTLKQNILMGEKFIAEKFLKVLDVVEFDINRFAAAEQMEILDNGANLSIDERKKLLLARLLYTDGEIYCLDKCFDGWHSLLAERIFRRIIYEYLKDKTVIYTTY
jgi:ATP-binding cassette subfamily C (CFTR/MRP) protein 4